MDRPRTPTRLRLDRERLFYLALIVVAAVATLALMVFTVPASAATYRATLAQPVGELPFGLELNTVNGKPVAVLTNGANRVTAEHTRFDGKHLVLSFPSYDATMTADRQPDGSFSGTAQLTRKTGPVVLPFKAVPGPAWRFFKTPAKPVGLDGNWLVQTSGADAERGVAILHQTGNRISGTVQFPSGDDRFLVGEVSGNKFALSTFDGDRGSVWRGTLAADGTLAGETFGPTSKAPVAWTGRRQGKTAADRVVAVVEEKPPVERLDIAFPDTDGKRVTLTDPRFRGKVVLVAIGGSWCPNCHDEAAFLAPYAARRKAEGLEVVGLSFEYGTDAARATTQIKRFGARYHIAYPLLYAGVAGPEGSKVALPQLGGVKVYPTTLFVDRKGKLRSVHVGYAGPATGALNKAETAKMDAYVTRLLREKA
ncbi:peroxiredoxin family protein [Glacieibacterium sp.]|uniref:peroxiredoxin family protein n=1 Tax=Glacieibacterium sp. TaxID=2860237 RepID=UPI003AFF851A